MIDHLTLTVTDLARSRAFYELTLAPLGYTIKRDFEQFVGFGDERKPYFWLKQGEAQRPMHLAFVARSRTLVDESGAVVGRHDGVHKFTVGQRRGLGVAAPEPRYVIAVDALTLRVTVGPQESLLRSAIEIEDVRWPSGVPAEPVRARVQIRYRHEARPATVAPLDGARARVTFDDAERAPAPGQAAVFYDGETVLGGGFIAR